MTTSAARERIPSVWLGLVFSAWYRMLRCHGTKIALHNLPLAGLITLSSLLQSTGGLAERIVLGRRISRASLREPPLFVVGHWRSGTSLLHELLCLDRRHSYANTYECFNPAHFLLTENFLKLLLKPLLPTCRPQENMRITFDTPQEDECGLCGLGAPSPYVDIAFPNQWDSESPAYSLAGLPQRAQQRWEREFLRFLRKITLIRPGRVVLKSPTHTFRIPVLQRLFPGAVFVHIVRNPYRVYASTVHLWHSVSGRFALQAPDFSGLQGYVLQLMLRAHAAVARAKPLVPPARFYALRYEDLVARPVETMSHLYQSLDLGDARTTVLPALEGYLAQRSRYRTNPLRLGPAETAAVQTTCRALFSDYGYPLTPL